MLLYNSSWSKRYGSRPVFWISIFFLLCVASGWIAQTLAAGVGNSVTPKNVSPTSLPVASEATPDSTAADAQMNLDYTTPAGFQIPALHHTWLAEHDPAKRRIAAQELIQAAIWDQDDQGNSRCPDVIDEVTRNGAPKRMIAPSAPIHTVKLEPVFRLPISYMDQDSTGANFRRITKGRFEAWSPKAGWLFDAQGKLLTSVIVPRRDGSGREWYGAFLSDGTWITTDLWDDDKQLNAFTPKAEWKWELPGTEIIDSVLQSKPNPRSLDESIRPSIGWARADKTGRRWLVSVGIDETRCYALVDAEKKMEPLSDSTNFWNIVYPQAMGIRGTYSKSYIMNEDGRRMLVRTGTYHNIGVLWPIYSLPSRGNVVIAYGDMPFGFWHGSHEVYVQAGFNPTLVWFFDADGAYDGQIVGSYLAQAGNGRDLLLEETDGKVLRVSHGTKGLTVSEAQSYCWPDGTQATPVAVYDDLHLGFFLKKPGLQAVDDGGRKAPTHAETVLARWN